MAAYAPVVPTESAFIIFSGIDIGAETLIRFYVYHVIAFPLITAVFMAIHFWRIRKDGGISGPV
jgi:quinol-cytochrome oxidoreductase complex cytochrome b subunit